MSFTERFRRLKDLHSIGLPAKVRQMVDFRRASRAREPAAGMPPEDDEPERP
ncbi:hypothetical protein N599_07320 [Saccharopolyspora erythraea D]|nr:hypothetical protein N599_07320 [Saccharopolyspora erythraea D]